MPSNQIVSDITLLAGFAKNEPGTSPLIVKAAERIERWLETYNPNEN